MADVENEREGWFSDSAPPQGQEPLNTSAGDDGALFGVARQSCSPIDETAVSKLLQAAVRSLRAETISPFRVVAIDQFCPTFATAAQAPSGAVGESSNSSKRPSATVHATASQASRSARRALAGAKKTALGEIADDVSRRPTQ